MGIFDRIGIPGLVLLVIAALIIFGPKRLPELGSSIGNMIREFKKAVNDSHNDDSSSKM